SRGRHTSFSRDWSSDVCSSDLLKAAPQVAEVNLMSHLACADEHMHQLTDRQLESCLGMQEFVFDQRSFANSAAVLTLAPAHTDRSEERRVGKECRQRGSRR